jgi:peptide/nickel transport system substrate-binding protein
VVSRGIWKIIALTTLLTIGLIIIPGVAAQTKEYQPPHSKPGPASERIYFRAFHVDIARLSMEADEMDLYSFSLKTEEARRLKGVGDIKVYQAPASSISLLVNPAPALEGELNPFSIRKVRQALQYVINRKFIAQEIYKGLAQPMITHVGPSDYDYITVFDLIKESYITYDPELAKQMIAEAMTAAHAEIKDGKWHFQGKPVQIKFIIRVEDERRDVGDLIRAEIEDLGFTVVSTYHSFAPAILTVYGTDPQLFQWHLYTEGWGKGAAERFDYSTINSMAAPWLGNLPGWQESGFWQYSNTELDDLGKRIFQGTFQDQIERDHLYRKLTELAFKESVRIWLATSINNFPASIHLQGVTEDIVSGPKSIWTLREAYIPGKDTLTIGHLWVWTERSTWNPIGGFGDVYSSDIWRNVYDPPIARDPFTGIPIPYRAAYEVETAGPQHKLDVPADAFIWDTEGRAFVPVGNQVAATSKVTFDYSKYFQSNWHHGQKITMADVLYSIYQEMEIAYNPDKARVEFAKATTSKPYLDIFRGFRITGDNDEKLEIYLDYWHFAHDYIAEYASLPGISMPWEILASMDRLVFEEQRAAYSDTAAQRFSVPWISLVMKRDSQLIRRTILDMLSNLDFPSEAFQINGKSLVTDQEVKARYEAVLTWIEQRDMAVISNGPFKLIRFDPPAQFAELEAFRDETYPFKPGDWFKGSASPIRIDTNHTQLISIGSEATVDLRIQGPEPIYLRYILQDPVTGEVLTRGEGPATTAQEFRITLTAEVTSVMTPGLYRLFIVASSEAISSPEELQLTLEASTYQADGTNATTLAQPTPTYIPTRSSSAGGLSCTGPPLLIPGLHP